MLNAYSIYDKKVKSFGTPFFAPVHEVCFRHMRRAVKNPDLDVGQFPRDYDLYLVGFFDEQIGDLQPTDRVNIGPLTQFLEE